MNNWPDILQQILKHTGLTPDIRCLKQVSGGCISSSFLIGADASQVFVKTHSLESLPMFEAEAVGLKTMANTNAIIVPEVLCTGTSNDVAFIAMQALGIHHKASSASFREFGQQLARMHRHQQPFFGSGIDNTLGSTPQPNTRTENWFNFWRKYRLGFQLDLARNNSAPHKLIDDGLLLNERFEAFFEGPPKAACLHGDLWQGNWGFTGSGKPVIFDPAHYFGDRETDIAMTALFGEAHPDFYAAYRESYPLREGYAVRKHFYNLYHVLNHFNLFDGAYAQQAHNMIKHLLSELS